MNNFGFVLAPKSLVEEKKKVRFMYREHTGNSADSGWRFFAGDETGEFVNDPNNIGIYDITTILEIDASIKPFLENPAECAYEREDTAGDFVPAIGFEFE